MYMKDISTIAGIISPSLCLVANHFNCKKILIIITIAYLFYVISQSILPIYLIILFCFFCFLLKLANNKNYLTNISIAIISLIFYFCLQSHIFPNVHNILIASNIIIGKTGIPWNLYVNHDKVLVSFIALLNIYFLPKNIKQNYISVLSILLFGIVSLIFLSLFAGFIKYDFKITPLLWLWGINNLFVVCVAEEVFFRLFLYNTLAKINIFGKYNNLYSLLLSSLLFGLFHYSGGWLYILLAVFAGIIYCLLYIYSGKLYVSILGHFLLNLIHFIFFSYPRAV